MRLLLPLLVLCAACADTRAARERGAAGLIENTPVYPAPKVDRCAKLKGGGAQSRCDEAKYLADLYVRRLSTGDGVCLDGGFGDAPGGACLARASVADVATGMVLLEVREAKPDSRWFHRESNQFWFEEGALVDLYLQEHGY